MAMTSDETKKDDRIEEYQRLRKVWAKYVDGLVERAGTKPGRVIGFDDPKPTVLTLRQWAETMVEVDARGPRVFVDPAGVRWQVGIAAVEHRSTRWMALRGKAEEEINYLMEVRSVKELARYMAERAGVVDVVPWGDVDNDETILAYESKGYGIAPVTSADDLEDEDQVEFSIRSKSSVTGHKIDVWFAALKIPNRVGSACR